MNEILLLVETKEGVLDKTTLELIRGGATWPRNWALELQQSWSDMKPPH